MREHFCLTQEWDIASPNEELGSQRRLGVVCAKTLQHSSFTTIYNIFRLIPTFNNLTINNISINPFF